MSDSSKTDLASKTKRQGSHGASLLNKLPAASRRNRKRAADKTRRQHEQRQLREPDDE